MKGITRLAYVAMKVADIENSLRYYRDGLECSEMFRRRCFPAVRSSISAHRTEFIELHSRMPSGRTLRFGAQAPTDHFVRRPCRISRRRREPVPGKSPRRRLRSAAKCPVGLDYCSAGAEGITWSRMPNQSWRGPQRFRTNQNRH